MPLDFPSSPNTGDSWTGSNGVEYIWDGVKWVAAGAPGGTGAFLPLSGGTMLGPLNWISTGTTTSRSAQDRSAATFNVKDFGAVGDGTTDDTQALQAAANAATATGGVVTIDRTTKLYINGSVSLPLNVGLRGEFRFGGGRYNPGQDWYSLGSQIRLGPAGLITLESSDIERLLFIRAGLYTSLPQNPTDATNLLANFGGVGLNMPSVADVRVEGCLFLGFATGISAPTASRMNVIDCRFDCTNGIVCGNSVDISRYHRNHFLPFLTIIVPGVGPAPDAYLPLQRSGAAMQMNNNMWDQLVDCFQFGWYQGFVCNNCDNPVFVNTHSDYTTPADNSVAGFQFLGTTAYAKMIGCLSVSCNKGVIVNASGTLNPLVEITGGSYIVHQEGVDVVAGRALVLGASFEVGGTVGVAFGAGCLGGAVIGCNFDGVTTAVTFANAGVQAVCAVLGNVSTGGTPVMPEQTFAPLSVPQIAVGGAASADWQTKLTGAGTDQNNSDIYVSGTSIAYRLLNDPFTAANNWLTVTRSGYVPTEITLTAAQVEVVGLLQTTSNISAAGGVAGGFMQSGGATWTSGAGVPGPAQPQPPGSLFSNTAGSVGSHLYVSAGGGTWNAVAGV